MHENQRMRKSIACEKSGPGGRWPAQEIAAEAAYDTDDPYAVALYLEKRRVEWVVGRELLSAGLEAVDATVGEGDVRIRRVATLVERDGVPAVLDEVRLDLSSPNGEACVWVAAADLTVFLQETYVAVPEGGEGVACHRALDAFGLDVAGWASD
jgi:hypothetical protein